MTAAFGLFIAALGGSPEATRGLAILATLLMVMLVAPAPSFLFPSGCSSSRSPSPPAGPWMASTP